MDRFSWNFISKIFRKIFEKISSFIKIWQNNGYFTQTRCHIWLYFAEFFLKWEMFQIKVVEKIKTRILCLITFFLKPCRLCDNVEKYGGAREATGDNRIRRMRFACWVSKAKRTHTPAHLSTPPPPHQHTPWQAQKYAIIISSPAVVCLCVDFVWMVYCWNVWKRHWANVVASDGCTPCWLMTHAWTSPLRHCHVVLLSGVALCLPSNTPGVYKFFRNLEATSKSFAPEGWYERGYMLMTYKY